MNSKTWLCILAAASFASSGAVEATSPTAAEMGEARRFTAAKFEGTAVAKWPDGVLEVLANHDPVIPNSRGGRPLTIVERQYTRGLYCHAVSKVVVRLPGPGKTFSAVVGVDSNDQTRPGRGSVVFSVTVGDKTAFRSPLMREGMAAVPVEVDLAGAKEFVLDVGDGGDGIACDQSDWADARVVLADGRTVWLGDLPTSGIYGSYSRTYGTEPLFSFTYDGKPSAELLPKWSLDRKSQPLDAQRTRHTLSYSDAKTGLAVRCEGIEYRDFPTLEWTLYFKNTGDKETPILSDIQALDTHLVRMPGPSTPDTEFRLHHNVGSPCAERLSAVGNLFVAGSDQTDHGRRRSLDQQRPLLFQPATRGERGTDRRGGLARSMGGSIHPRQRESSAHLCGAGADPFQAAARRGSAHADDGRAVLEGRLPAFAEPLAPLDDGP